MEAAKRLAEEWTDFQRGEAIACALNVVVHKGTLHAFRSFLISPDLDLAVNLQTATSRLASGEASIFATREVRAELAGTPWDGRLAAVEVPPAAPRLGWTEAHRLTAPDASAS